MTCCYHWLSNSPCACRGISSAGPDDGGRDFVIEREREREREREPEMDRPRRQVSTPNSDPSMIYTYCIAFGDCCFAIFIKEHGKGIFLSLSINIYIFFNFFMTDFRRSK